MLDEKTIAKINTGLIQAIYQSPRKLQDYFNETKRYKLPHPKFSTLSVSQLSSNDNMVPDTLTIYDHRTNTSIVIDDYKIVVTDSRCKVTAMMIPQRMSTIRFCTELYIPL
jgi:hypothetical protein